MIDAQRIKTMRERLGEASSLVDDDQFLPMFRNRQINHEELFNYSVELSKKKKNPSHYFANIWGKKNLEKTIKWLKQLVAKAQSLSAALFWQQKKKKYDKSIEMNTNYSGIDRLNALKMSHGLRS